MAGNERARDPVGGAHRKKNTDDKDKLIEQLKIENLLFKDELRNREEELEAQAEELEAQLEELRVNNEELERQIEERRRAEAAIRKSRFIMAKSQEMAHVGNWAWNVQTGEIKGSDEAYRIYGYSPAEVRPEEDWIMGRVHPDDKALLAGFVDAVRGGGRRKSIDHRIVRPDGTVRHVSTIADKTVRDPSGNVRWVYGITQDVTERKGAEAALRESEARRKVSEAVEAEKKRLFGVLETLPAMICLLTPDHHVAFANRAFRDKFGESRGRHCYEYCFGREAPCEFCEAYSVLETGRPHRWEVSTPNGSVIDVSNIPFKDADGSPMILEMNIDITERKKAEAELKELNTTLEQRVDERTAQLQEKQEELEVHAEELEVQAEELRVNNEELERHIEERRRAGEQLKEAKMQAELYLDLMGHDISNMHQIAISQLELAQEAMAESGKLEGGDKELIDTPIETLRRSAALIDNVRKLQKLRAGEYKTETVDLGRLLADVAREHAAIPDNDAVINYDPVEGYYVMANPLLKDVFANLVGNAVKHSNGSATINITADEVTDGRAPYYRVAIEDNGPGISDEKKGEVFHRFKRGQTSTRGTGLGLYIVKTLVDNFRGRVTVEDRVPGDHTKDSKFMIMLPAANNGRLKAGDIPT